MANTALKLTELDFNQIKFNLKEYLRNQQEFTDFDFEGSGMSVLLDILAYNTHYMGYYLNMVGNEMFLDTAQLRGSMSSLAKLTNYIPTSTQAAEAVVNITITPTNEEDQTPQTLTIDKYTKLLGKDIDGVNYPFVAMHSNTAPKIAGSFSFANVRIKQGEVTTTQYLVDFVNTKRRFTIPSQNADTDTLVVTVSKSVADAETVEYKRLEDATLVDGNTAIYFVEENEDQEYSLYFGDGYIGKYLDNGNVVTATYLESNGANANGISKFAFVDPVAGLYRNSVQIDVQNASRGGSDKEPIEQIRFRAPHYYTAQNRCVTALDYATLIQKDFPIVEAVSVWGGEEYEPPVFGKVYISLKTKGSFGLSNKEKENIKQTLIRNRNVLTVIPEIIDPDFVFLQIQGKVTFNSSLTNKTSNQLLDLVKAAILDYVNDQLGKFDSVLRKSKLQYYIENCDPAITGSDIQIYLQKRVDIKPNVYKNYVINYDLPLRKGDFLVKLTTTPLIKVKDTFNVERQVFIEEVPESYTGIDSIIIVNPGKNYDYTPRVTITGDGLGAMAEAKIVNGKIDTIKITNKGSNYTRAIVSIEGTSVTEATAIAKLERRYGTLRTVYFKDTGEKIIVNGKAGTVDYTDGTIFLEGLVTPGLMPSDYYDLNVLTFSVPSDTEIINPLRNRLLDFDEFDPTSIIINMVAE